MRDVTEVGHRKGDQRVGLPQSLLHVDPECRDALRRMQVQFPGGLNAIEHLQERRAAAFEAMTGGHDPAASWADGAVTETGIKRPDGQGVIRVRVFTPANICFPNARLLLIHGGGMVMGGVVEESNTAITLADALGVPVVAVGYRLAPEDPYPAALNDCEAVVRALSAGVWTPEGPIRPRIVVYGGSAGGGLALALALKLRDEGGPTLAFVMAPYPMLDDRHETASSRQVLNLGIWDREGSIECWSHYLGAAKPDQYAAPARAMDLSGLPQLFIDVGGQDLFRDEAVDFARRALDAGVPVELHVYPGAYHASEFIAPEAKLSRRILNARFAAMRAALDEGR